MKTRAALQRALIELAVERGYDEVTVQDVADRADVSRSSFYAHYADKDDLLAASIGNLKQGMARHWRESLAAGAERGSLSFARPLLHHIGEGRAIWQALTRGRSASVLDREFRQMVAELAVADLRLGGQPVVVRETACASVVGSFMAVVSAWMDGRIEADAAEVERLYLGLVLPGLAAIAAEPGSGQPTPGKPRPTRGTRS